MKWEFREVRMFVQLDFNLGLSGSNILLLPWYQLPPTEGRRMSYRKLHEPMMRPGFR